MSMLNPAGAVIQAIIAIYNTITFFIEKIQQIAAVVASFIDSIAAIAAGMVAGAAKKVEQTMANTLTVVIAFLAKFAGLGDIPAKITGIIKKIREPIDKGLDKIVTWLGNMLKKLGAAIIGKKDEDKDKKGTDVGESVPFTAGSDPHRIFIKVAGTTATVMVESASQPLEATLSQMESQVPTLAPESRSKAPALIGRARSLLSKTDKEADQVATAVSSPESVGAGTALSINDQVKSDEHTLAATLGELFTLFGGEGGLPLSVPVNMAGAGHTLIIKDEGGHLTVWFATKEQSIRDKYAQVDRILKRWEDYISSLGNPAIEEEFTILIKPDIEAKRTARLQGDVARLEGIKTKEFGALKEEVDKTIKQLTQEISDWATSAGIPVQDFSDEAIKAELDRRADEAAEKVWRERQEETQQKLAEYAAKIQALDPAARLKYRGSLAKYRRGVSKGFAEFDPLNFDIDFFVESDKLYVEALEAMGGMPERPGELWAEAHPGLRAILDDMAAAYDTITGVRKGKFSMKLRSVTNVQALLAKKGTREYAGEAHVEITPPRPTTPPPPLPTKP